MDIEDHMSSIFDRYKDKKLILVKEEVFTTRSNINTGLTIAKVHGIADLVAARHGYPDFHQLGTTAIKRILTGDGKAEKDMVAEATMRYVGPHEYGSDDESDAVAVGLAWLIEEKLLKGVKKDAAEKGRGSPG